MITKVSPAIYACSLQEVKDHLRVNHSHDDDLIRSLLAGANDRVQQEVNRQLVTATYQMKIQSWWDREIRIPFPPLLKVNSITYFDEDNASQTLASSNYDVSTYTTPGKIRWAYDATIPSVYYRPDAVTIEFIAGYCLSFTVNDTTNVFTVAEILDISDGARVRLRTSDTLPAPLVEGKDYYLRDSSGLTFKVAETSGGSAVDLTTSGTGKHYVDLVPEPLKQAIKIAVGTWYDVVTEDVSVGYSTVQPMPMAGKYLMEPYRVWTL
jgi:uncharacterized phiE125 gp8 family phage protein